MRDEAAYRAIWDRLEPPLPAAKRLPGRIPGAAEPSGISDGRRDRFNRILRTLRSGGPAGAAHLALRCAVSVNTIYGDMSYLIGSGEAESDGGNPATYALPGQLPAAKAASAARAGVRSEMRQAAILGCSSSDGSPELRVSLPREPWA